MNNSKETCKKVDKIDEKMRGLYLLTNSTQHSLKLNTGMSLNFYYIVSVQILCTRLDSDKELKLHHYLTTCNVRVTSYGASTGITLAFIYILDLLLPT